MAGIPRLIEPVFEVAGQPWPALSADDIQALENTIARQSAELNQRIIEVADLYNFQQRQDNELQAARREVDRLNQIVSSLQQAVARHKAVDAAAQNKIALLENEKADLHRELERVVQESRRVEG